MRNAILAALALATPLAAQAEDAALVLGTERYEQLGRLSRGAEAVDAIAGLESLGFTVVALPNGRAPATMQALAEWIGLVPDAERLVVVLSGRFATDGTRTWFLTAETNAPTLLTLGDRGVSVESVMRVLARRQGQSVLLLGSVDSDTRFDPWLVEGIGGLDVPQGVTVLRGGPRAVADFLGDEMGQPGGDLGRLVRDDRDITGQGFLPLPFVLMPAEAEAPEPEQQPQPPQQPDAAAAEDALWNGAVALDTVEAYRGYLARYPQGRHAAEAEEAIAGIIAEPNRDARLAEEALNLTRDQRRDIQRSLSLLDYNTRGIDGIFGPGSRGAITNWQQQNGFGQTGYLTPEQITRLDAQSARRSAELEAEAERQRQAEAARDRAFWDETGSQGDEPGLRAYLERYPDGQFAEQATDALERIEAAKREEAQQQDRIAWDRAREADRADGYRAYLSAFPDGAFKAEAEARIAALAERQNNAEANAAAQAEEEALGLNALTARLVEARLEALDLEPGAVDGQFDQDSRRALRRFQRDRNLPVTGFLNEATVVRLLADSIGNVLQQ